MKLFTKGRLALLLVVCLFLSVPIYQSQTATVLITSASLSGRTCYADSIIAAGTFDTLRLIGFSGSMETITEATAQVTVTAIDDTVIVQMEGTLDAVNWFTVDGPDTLIANGTYGLRYVGVNSLYAFRLNWVVDSGDTARVAIIVKAG